ncbi:MAG TPA: hypothetical protein VJU77_08745 [Chthoniobacterales bacterium]|nr:hypothetical protein [Chthoniobacterales bacterium]
MKAGPCVLILTSLLLVATAQGAHWAELELPESAISAIHHEDTKQLVAAVRGVPKAKLNAGLITACRLGKLEAVKALVDLGAEPSFVIQRHPAIAEESPLRYAIESDNLDLVAFLLDCKGALHLNHHGDPLELGTAAGTGRVDATAKILTALRQMRPSRYQAYIESAIVLMVWNKQKDAAISIISHYTTDLPNSSLERLKKSVVALGGASSLALLEEVWQAGRR